VAPVVQAVVVTTGIEKHPDTLMFRIICWYKCNTVHMFKIMTPLGASGHLALTVFVILSYAGLTCASIMRKAERSHCRHLSLRATRLLRDAAKSSLKVDKEGYSAAEKYAEAVKSSTFIEAVECILSAQEVARFTGISIDDMKAYVDQQVEDSYADLDAQTAACKPSKQKPISSIAVPPSAAATNQFVW
jgi:histone H3/H4